MNHHITKRIAVKFADIDIKMIPLIQWMNSFDGICTIGCCEGVIPTQQRPEGCKPSATFRCWDMVSLASIIGTVNGFAQTVIYYQNDHGLIYTTTFTSQQSLLSFSEGLKDFNNES